MRSLFFQDHCGVLDVFQTCLTVFTPFSPGACGRNGRFLECGDSLPGGGCHPARAPCVCLRWPPCPQLPLDVVEGGPLFTLVGHGFGHAVSAWGAQGYPMESVASSSKLLSWEPGGGLHLKDRQSFLQMRSCPKPFSSRPGLSFVGTRSWTYFPLCTLCFRTETALVYARHQEGFAWLGNQTLWVNLRAGCPGGSEPQRSICSGQQHAIRGCVEKQQPKWRYWEGVLHLCFLQGCFSWFWRAAGESSACPILGMELLTEPFGTRLYLTGLHWIFIPLKYGTSGAFGAVCVHCTNCRHPQFKRAFWLLLKDGNGVYLLVRGVV